MQAPVSNEEIKERQALHPTEIDPDPKPAKATARRAVQRDRLENSLSTAESESSSERKPLREKNRK